MSHSTQYRSFWRRDETRGIFFLAVSVNTIDTIVSHNIQVQPELDNIVFSMLQTVGEQNDINHLIIQWFQQP